MVRIIGNRLLVVSVMHNCDNVGFSAKVAGGLISTIAVSIVIFVVDLFAADGAALVVGGLIKNVCVADLVAGINGSLRSAALGAHAGLVLAGGLHVGLAAAIVLTAGTGDGVRINVRFQGGIHKVVLHGVEGLAAVAAVVIMGGIIEAYDHLFLMLNGFCRGDVLLAIQAVFQIAAGNPMITGDHVGRAADGALVGAVSSGVVLGNIHSSAAENAVLPMLVFIVIPDGGDVDGVADVLAGERYIRPAAIPAGVAVAIAAVGMTFDFLIAQGADVPALRVGGLPGVAAAHMTSVTGHVLRAAGGTSGGIGAGNVVTALVELGISMTMLAGEPMGIAAIGSDVVVPIPIMLDGAVHASGKANVTDAIIGGAGIQMLVLLRMGAAIQTGVPMVVAVGGVVVVPVVTGCTGDVSGTALDTQVRRLAGDTMGHVVIAHIASGTVEPVLGIIVQPLCIGVSKERILNLGGTTVSTLVFAVAGGEVGRLTIGGGFTAAGADSVVLLAVGDILGVVMIDALDAQTGGAAGAVAVHVGIVRLGIAQGFTAVLTTVGVVGVVKTECTLAMININTLNVRGTAVRALGEIGTIDRMSAAGIGGFITALDTHSPVSITGISPAPIIAVVSAVNGFLVDSLATGDAVSILAGLMTQRVDGLVLCIDVTIGTVVVFDTRQGAGGFFGSDPGVTMPVRNDDFAVSYITAASA